MITVFNVAVKFILAFLLLLLPLNTWASNQAMKDCLFEKMSQADPQMTLKQFSQMCSDEIAAQKKDQPAIFNRINSERADAFDPYVITPHKMNYFLPFSYTNNINRDAYQAEGNWSDDIKSTEAKFQISFKIPLVANALFIEGDGIAFGFTLQSWWQLYTKEISRAFRETNYEPEIFYYAPLSWEPAGGKMFMMTGIVHQSNGRSQLLSRSWNRVYANFIFAKGNYLVSFRPWWKIPEGDKVTTPEESGNDNPDISDYMGHFELSMAYKWDEYELSVKGRQNFSHDNGALELGITFPLTGKLKGYFQYANGYGESLIDYNHSQQRFGLGIAITDFF